MKSRIVNIYNIKEYKCMNIFVFMKSSAILMKSKFKCWETCMSDIGENLKNARKIVGLRQEDAANTKGMLRVTLSLIESGKRKVSTDELIKFSELYKIAPSVLLGYNFDNKNIAKKNLRKYLQLGILCEKFLNLNDNDRQEILDFIDLKISK